MTWGIEDSTELTLDYLASDPSGEHVPPGDLDDMTIAELDRFVSDMQRLRSASTELGKYAKEHVLDRIGMPDKSGDRYAARVGSRAYVHQETRLEYRWVSEREALEFLWEQGGATAVLKAHTGLRLRSPAMLRRFVAELELDWELFADTFLAEKVSGPAVSLVDLDNEKAPKWAGALPDYLDGEFTHE
jgi:hypothetical protein